VVEGGREKQGWRERIRGKYKCGVTVPLKDLYGSRYTIHLSLSLSPAFLYIFSFVVCSRSSQGADDGMENPSVITL
jgi:hypothetical protein